MNCFEYRRRRRTEPAHCDAELLAHERTCPACSAFVQGLMALEAPLENALRIDVPEGLVSRILLAQSLTQRGRLRAGYRPVYGLVAGVLLLLGVTARVWLAGPSLEQTVLAHVHEEAYSLGERGTVPVVEVNRLMGGFDQQVRASLGAVHYAGRCTIHRHAGAHLVVEGEKGPVTILFMPGEKIAGRVILEDARFDGILVPAGDASFAIVGEHGEHLEAVERRFRAALTS